RNSYEELINQGNKYPFRPGMTASVEIITKIKAGVLSVPLSSVTTRNPDDKGSEEKKGPQNSDDDAPKVTDSSKPKEKKADKIVVFVNEKGVAKMVEVKTGISDYDNIEIISGIADDAEVVTGPFLVVSKRLKDGDKIIQAPKPDDKKGKEEKAEKK
ncbi:MAG TPA: efflux transporter periplasmic adaptor subunit, partial [Cyclobacteriaceae bacterium]